MFVTAQHIKLSNFPVAWLPHPTHFRRGRACPTEVKAEAGGRGLTIPLLPFLQPKAWTPAWEKIVASEFINLSNFPAAWACHLTQSSLMNERAAIEWFEESSSKLKKIKSAINRDLAPSPRRGRGVRYLPYPGADCCSDCPTPCFLEWIFLKLSELQ